MPFVDLGTTALRYDYRPAEGPLLVLIHEMGGSLESWDGVLPLIDDRIAVVRYDMRGSGLSEKISATITHADMSADLRALLDALEVKGPVYLSGCAVGAGVALDFAGRHPDRVSGIVAFAPAAGVAEDRREGSRAFVSEIERQGMRFGLERAVIRSFPPELGVSEAVMCDYAARWLGNDPRSFGQIYRMLIESSLPDRLHQVACSTLLVAGDFDASRPAAIVKPLVNAIPRALFDTVPSGHYMPVQTPGPVAQKIMDFIDRGG